MTLQVELMRVLIEVCPSAVGNWLCDILQTPAGVSFGVRDSCRATPSPAPVAPSARPTPTTPLMGVR